MTDREKKGLRERLAAWLVAKLNPLTPGVEVLDQRTLVRFDMDDESTWPRKGESALFRHYSGIRPPELVRRVMDRDWREMNVIATPPEYTERP